MRFFVLICFFFAGCGYHVRSISSSSISVPYVAGDVEGYFTSSLIQKIASNPLLDYSLSGDYCLKVCLLEPVEENIGFKYAPSEKDEKNFSKILSPEEARVTLTATCSLYDQNDGSLILGPFEVTTAYTYDFESDFSNLNVHRFSLSQLEMHTLAQDEAFDPLYGLLAQKIVDTVSASWYSK